MSLSSIVSKAGRGLVAASVLALCSGPASAFTLSGPSGRSTGLFVLPDLDQDISATEIRAALAEGSEQQTVLAPPVAEYIRSHSLYRPVGIP